MKELIESEKLYECNLYEEAIKNLIYTFLLRLNECKEEEDFFDFFYNQFSIYLMRKNEPLIKSLAEGDMISDLILQEYDKFKKGCCFQTKYNSASYIIDFPCGATFDI